MRSSQKIGIFDSGFGGMSVAVELTRLLPNEEIIYIGDSAHFPYGTKSLEEVREYGLKICHKLVDMGVKLIIIACNTSTVATLEAARNEILVPVIGVVEPGARAAVNRTANKKIGVLATNATVASNAYVDAVHKYDNCEVYQVAAPGFVEMAENGIKHVMDQMGETFDIKKSLAEFSEILTPHNIGVAQMYCVPLLQKQVDTIILGCTHFTLLKPIINAVCGQHVMLVSSSRETVKDAKAILEKDNLLNDNPNPEHYFCTTGDNVQKYKEFGAFIFGEQLNNVDKLCVF